MATAARLPSINEQDFIGPEGRELLATLAEVENEGKVQKFPSLHPYGSATEAWPTRTAAPSDGGQAASQGGKESPHPFRSISLRAHAILRERNAIAVDKIKNLGEKDINKPEAGLGRRKEKFAFSRYDDLQAEGEEADEDFRPYLVPLNEDLDTKLRKWSKTDKTKVISVFNFV